MKCDAKLATPDCRSYCQKPAQFLFRKNRGDGDWRPRCARHARVSVYFGERRPLPECVHAIGKKP